MAETKIEWTDFTWNFIRGCSRVSEGCKNCYAESIAKRFSGDGLPYAGTIGDRGKWNGNITFHEDKLLEALKWKTPRKVFVNSMSDLFHENVADEWIDKAFAVMALTPHITYQILTKRPERMREYVNCAYASGSDWCMGDAISNEQIQVFRAATGRYPPTDIAELFPYHWPLSNVWLGVSVEDQKTADERIPHLLQVPAAVRFLSVEPLLGKIEFSNVSKRSDWKEQLGKKAFQGIHWVIVGGESGPNARPMHPDWVRSIRDLCVAADVPFFFKQHGEFVLDPLANPADKLTRVVDHQQFTRIGKKKAGRLLDGREWNQFPEVSK